MKGVVKRYSTSMRIGSINAEDGKEYVVHEGDIEDVDEPLFTGQKVTFELGTDKRGVEVAKKVQLYIGY